ncbi:MAG: hypothetical protein ABIK28_02285, partial [Planctomycetota bacterium]
ESYSYYFNGQYSLIALGASLVDLQLLQYPLDQIIPPNAYRLARILLLSGVVLLVLFGCFRNVKAQYARAFLLSLVGYVIIHFAGDQIMDTQTLAQNKFQFFLIPAAILILAGSLWALPRRFSLRLPAVLACVLLSAAGSTQVLNAKINFDGPILIRTFENLLRTATQENTKNLVIINTKERRQLLSFVHAMKHGYDYAILTEDDVEKGLAKVVDLLRYEQIFLVDLHVFQNKKPNFTNEERKIIAQYLRKSGFGTITYLYKDARSKLVRFEKTP